MAPEEITLGGKHGTVVYFDNQWHPVENKDDATMAKVRFDDGRIAFYRVGPVSATS